MRTPVTHYSDLGRAASREHRVWRKRLLERLRESQPNLLHDVRDIEGTVDAFSGELLSIAVMLAKAHGTPDLGNKPDPVDELVYIILSRRTREGAYQAAFDALKSSYETWDELAVAPPGEIERVIRFSGLGNRKARSLKSALGGLILRFGRCTLEPTRTWDDGETSAFLCTLPEIGPKSAACVMMCSLDRPAFPVDAHVGRVLERLGIFRAVGIELEGVDHKVKQRLLWDAVPPALRYSLHVNMLVHGRLVCTTRKPRCTTCVLVNRCSYGKRTCMSAGPL